MLLRSASSAPDLVALGTRHCSRQMPLVPCSRFISSSISLDTAGLITSPRSSFSTSVAISCGVVRPRPNRLLSSFLPSKLSPPPKTRRIRRVSLSPSDSIRALIASVVKTSITRFVAVLSLKIIINVTPSRNVRCKPSANSLRIPEPPTFFTKAKKVGGSGILNEFADGLHLTFRDGVTLMMILSDNTATNLVIDVLTTDAINARMESLGLKETRLMRRVFGGGESLEGKKEESKRFGLGRTTPHEMATLVEKLERGEVISPAVSKEMLELMKREQGTNGIWRGQWRLPKATKSGALDALRSNLGIIYHPRGRIVVAITCSEMPELNWTVDNPALLLMSRLSDILVDGLGK